MGMANCHATDNAQNEAFTYLDNLAIIAETDKSSVFHNYTRVYAKYFDAIRNDNIRFLEIGISRGASVKLWESYFVNAELHFIDINPNQIEYHSPAVQYHFADQANIKAMQQIANNIGGQFDIVIDDGGHIMNQQINSFKALFPYMKSQGLYIIEDLHTSYWKEYGGHGRICEPKPGPGTCVSFLQGLVDDLNYTAGVTTCADFNKIPDKLRHTLNEYQKGIDSIHFYQSLCIIIKK
jgi:hypothetical protein